jgi:glycine/D-amino acid oxidase-like deaminating enzyme
MIATDELERYIQLGSFSEIGGLTLIFGSWYGFALAPAIGKSVADHLAGLPTPELDQLSPDRIAQFDPERIATLMGEQVT